MTALCTLGTNLARHLPLRGRQMVNGFATCDSSICDDGLTKLCEISAGMQAMKMFWMGRCMCKYVPCRLHADRGGKFNPRTTGSLGLCCANILTSCADGANASGGVNCATCIVNYKRIFTAVSSSVFFLYVNLYMRQVAARI